MILEQVNSPDLYRLEQLYNAGFQNAFLDNILRKMIVHQIERDEADLAQIEVALAEFENQYKLTSQEFWPRYQAGEMADTADFMEWNTLGKIRERLTSRLQILSGNGNHE